MSRGVEMENTMFTIIRDLLKGNPHRKPVRPIPIELIDSLPPPDGSQTKAIWFGHSTIWLEIEGKKILFDPTFSNTPSPFPLIGGKRFNPVLPIAPEKLPLVDLVVLSHDHYDHMDYRSIMLLKDKTNLFCVPCGVGKRLEGWGIASAKIQEFNWWDEAMIGGLKMVCTPAHHFSGRSLFDRNTTLWCSWSIVGQHTSVFFSGDGGYGPHFKQIGQKHGPFALTFMECGQYDARWSSIHMTPEETIQAHIDVQGNILLPIHWGAFSLAFHAWTDPIERAIKVAAERKVNLTTPKIGESVLAGSVEYPTTAWWR
jgi:L-ascorbate metabolism protein UlaG (beta-lactamase superfamily)